jgi:gliding motility-associated-like protein
MWIKFQVATAGNVVFTITPSNQYDDYDFAVIDITNTGCTNWTAANIVRCDANNNNTGSSPGGIVGLNTTATATNVPGGTFGSPFVAQLPVTVGQTYLVMIDWAGNYANPASTASGFTIDFSGSTATFVGGNPPLYDTIAFACDYRNGLQVHMTDLVKCNSLQSNGSDFQISPALATVTSAVGAGCTVPTNTTQTITLAFSNPLPPGVYYLKAKNGTDANTLVGQCNGIQPLTDSIMFRVENPPTLNLGPDTITCVGNSIQLNAVTGGGPFLSSTITWSPGTYLSSTTIANPITTPTNDITYQVTYTPNGHPQCATTATLNIAVLQPIDLANHDTTLCKGASMQLTLNGDPRYTYNWTPLTYLNANVQNPTSTPDTTISYSVTATHAGCTPQTKNITITVQPVPTVYIGADVTICFGDTLQMNPFITPGNYTGYTYSWTPPVGFNFPNTKDPVFLAQDSTTATLTVTTSAGCTGSDTRELYVIPRDFAIVSRDTGICPNKPAQLHVTGGITYIWTPNIYMSSDTSADPIVMPLTTTTYTVYAANSFKCKDTQSVTVTVFPQATFDLPDTMLIYAGKSVTMNPATNCLYFSWFPPLGLSDDQIANPVANPNVNTEYFITAQTELGCVAYDTVDVLVSYDSYLDVPNAFTPGSGPNNTLKPVHLGDVTLMYFRIFDRWGAKVYESNNLEDGWDGTFNGKNQPMGVYVYMIQGKLANGKMITKSGNSTLLR